MDEHVGLRLREARIDARMTGSELAARMGVTAQQVSKLERSLNRLHAGQLWMASQILGRPVDWFFEAPSVVDRKLRSARKGREFFAALASLEPDQVCLVADMARELADARVVRQGVVQDSPRLPSGG